jgi:calcineurin-like phosphoesterase family protein
VEIYYTADQHFGHENIIKHCQRPFRNVEEMDSFMIERWNERVSSEDEVYIIGDLIFRSGKQPEEYLEQLHGRKHLLLGNHDGSWLKKI